MCRLRKCDYRTDRHTHTDGRTDAGQSEPYVPLCFAGDTKTRAPMGHWSLTWVQWAFLYLYKLDSRVKKFDYGMEPKTTKLRNTSCYIIAMNSVCCCSLQVWSRSSLKKGTPYNLFILPPLGSVPGHIWPKHLNACAGTWTLHPYQVS